MESQRVVVLGFVISRVERVCIAIKWEANGNHIFTFSSMNGQDILLFILSVHLSNQLVDFLLAVTQITSLHESLELAFPESASWVAQFEWP